MEGLFSLLLASPQGRSMNANAVAIMVRWRSMKLTRKKLQGIKNSVNSDKMRQVFGHAVPFADRFILLKRQ